ncbi:hypothetical protein [Halomonas sp.]|uniref:hypothetical protein n=1 Tax=Halomonas sp. TaxID=1486246 RepID=UPI0038602C10
MPSTIAMRDLMVIGLANENVPDATTPRRHDATTPRRHDATTLLGWWFWDEMPDFWVFIGSVLIIGSSLAITYHERLTTLKRCPTS